MSIKRLITAAILLATAAPAFADDPIYVVRPPIVQMRANVLPANAFSASSTPSNPSQPSTPSPSYVFMSANFDNNKAPWNVGTTKATIKLGQTYTFSAPSIGACQLQDSWPKASASSYLSQTQRSVTPKVTGLFALALACDGVNNLPSNDPKSVYLAKALVTVEP
jgi:hypothetical protein